MRPWKIANSEALDGYTGLRKALTMAPDDLIALVRTPTSVAVAEQVSDRYEVAVHPAK